MTSDRNEDKGTTTERTETDGAHREPFVRRDLRFTSVTSVVGLF
jgi:hypothetical protein